MKIAGNRTTKQWSNLKAQLLSTPSQNLWANAFEDFYHARIKSRYLNPIASIERHDTSTGEGFAVVALFCSLVEFLESCEKGLNFHYIKRGEIKLAYEYDQNEASRQFTDFLKKRQPFDSLVPSNLVDSFYRHVRCGLLHEARTKGTWVISTSTSHGALIKEKNGKITLFRRQLVPSLELYFADYKSRLLSDSATQQAFIRKFDHLCQA